MKRNLLTNYLLHIYMHFRDFRIDVNMDIKMYKKIHSSISVIVTSKHDFTTSWCEFRLCFVHPFLLLNVLKQTVHWNVLSGLWTRRCCFRSCLLAKDLPQISQVCGRSPKCIARSWLLKLDASFIWIPQKLHSKYKLLLLELLVIASAVVESWRTLLNEVDLLLLFSKLCDVDR